MRQRYPVTDGASRLVMVSPPGQKYGSPPERPITAVARSQQLIRAEVCTTTCLLPLYQIVVLTMAPQCDSPGPRSPTKVKR